MSIEQLTLHAHGEPFRAAFLPSQKVAHGPGLIVVHEWWGLNDGIQALGARLAAEGFTVLVPDLYAGRVASDAAEAGALMQAMKTERSIEILGACVAELATRTGKKVGITGFCMGGAMAFAAAASLAGLACAVPFYGIPRADYFDAAKMRCPIQAHFAQRDDWARADRAAALAEAVNARGGRMELHVYDAGHAFMREGDPSVYSPAQAKIAWGRATEFLRAELG
ncbi:MAG: dienelactone hydrolase family protein [Sandaracinaceae bacterium]|nr:dienelactone hydrolase family protein [Sandaracinaceae bacterium]